MHKPRVRLNALAAESISCWNWLIVVQSIIDAAWCWGEGTDGRLGNGYDMTRSTPTAVVNLNNDVTAISAGGSHTCAIQDSGAWCWGQE